MRRSPGHGTADIGLIPTAALATTPGLRILPGCTIASKGRVRSLLLVRRASHASMLCAPWPPTWPAAPPWPTPAFFFVTGATPTSHSCPARRP